MKPPSVKVVDEGLIDRRSTLPDKQNAPPARDERVLPLTSRLQRPPTMGANPKWAAWVKAYQDGFPADKCFVVPSLSATNYYNSANAIFTALNKINGVPAMAIRICARP